MAATTTTDSATTDAAAARLAALHARRSSTAERRPQVAEVGKIVSAALASTAVLGLTAAYGWSARAAETEQVPPVQPGAAATADFARSRGLVPVPTAPAATQVAATAAAPVRVEVPVPVHATSEASN